MFFSKINLRKALCLLVSFSILSCSKESIENTYVVFNQPDNFPNPTYEFDVNPFTEAKFKLGKRLFYESKLSLDNSISCGTCHNQRNAFTHHGHALSDGVGGVFGTRNTQPLQNLAFMNDFTWDGAIRHLDLQPLVPIESEVEMKESVRNVLLKLQKDTSYVADFKKAFIQKENETHVVNIRTLTQSLSQFMNAMVSANSRYDRYIRGEFMEEPYRDDEKKGLLVFNNKCASCHAGALFTDQSYRNNGLGVHPNFPNELGRARVKDEDKGVDSPFYYQFKVPSLRNIWVTFPYMHDGRLATIDAVLEHYNSGVKKMDNLDPLLQNKGVLGIPLTTTDKIVLKAFLKSLTDEEFLKDERFAEF